MASVVISDERRTRARAARLVTPGPHAKHPTDPDGRVGCPRTLSRRLTQRRMAGPTSFLASVSPGGTPAISISNLDLSKDLGEAGLICGGVRRWRRRSGWRASPEGNDLEGLQAVIDFELFRPELETDAQRSSSPLCRS